MSVARTTQSDDSPNEMTVAAVSPANERTYGSSAFSTAVADAGRSTTSSPLARAIASRDPSTPRWAEPTLMTTPTSGAATSTR